MVDPTCADDTEHALESHVQSVEEQVLGRPSPDMAARLDQLRVARGYRSVRSFAIAADVTPSAMQNYFSRKSEPNSDSLRKISANMKVSIDWLTRGEGPMDYYQVGDMLPDGGVVAIGPLMTKTEPAQAVGSAPEPAHKMCSVVDYQRLGLAIQLSEEAFAANHQTPTYHRRGELIAGIYDLLVEQTPDFVRVLLDIKRLVPDPSRPK